MPKALLILGYALVALGVVVLGLYLARHIPFLDIFWTFIVAIPWPLRLALGAAALGVFLIFSALIVERIQNREADRKLRDDI